MDYDAALLFALIFLTALGGVLTAVQIDSRLSRRRTAAVSCGLVALATALNLAVYATWGLDTAVRVYPLIAHLPMMSGFALMSRERNGRLFFQLVSTVFFCVLVQHATGLAYTLTGYSPLVLIVAFFGLSAASVVFAVRWLRPFCLETMRYVERGWWFMSVMVVLYYVIEMYVIPGYMGSGLFATVAKPLVSLLMLGFYVVLVYMVTSVKRVSEARFEADVMAFELSALKARIDAINAAEEAVRIERHDLRHRLNAIAVLIERGERGRAQGLIDDAQQNLDAHRPMSWCRPPTLDAVFSSYFDQARLKGIEVDASIELPSELPVSEAELAVAVGNALDNAIRACAALPEDERRLSCRAIGHPSVMFEISNPYRGEVPFDARGLPVAEQDGRGTGARSIAAFSRRVGAACTFEATDGRFVFRLVL